MRSPAHRFVHPYSTGRGSATPKDNLSDEPGRAVWAWCRASGQASCRAVFPVVTNGLAATPAPLIPACFALEAPRCACSPVRRGPGSWANGRTAPGLDVPDLEPTPCPPPRRHRVPERRPRRLARSICPRGQGRVTPRLDRGSRVVSLVPREPRHVESGPGSCRRRTAVHGRTPTQHARGRGEPETAKRAAPREETP